MNSTSITPVESAPSVFLIVHDKDGVRGLMGSSGTTALADIICQAAERFPKEVKRRDDLVWPLGQDVFDVSWDYLLSIRGAFTFMKPVDVMSFHTAMPSTLRYSLVVTR